MTARCGGRKVHRARSPLEARVLFERYGETVVALLLATELAERPEAGVIKIARLWQKAIIESIAFLDLQERRSTAW
jgi:hypothetical protein